jgi:hypothetical protein
MSSSLDLSAAIAKVLMVNQPEWMKQPLLLVFQKACAAGAI